MAQYKKRNNNLSRDASTPAGEQGETLGRWIEKNHHHFVLKVKSHNAYKLTNRFLLKRVRSGHCHFLLTHASNEVKSGS